MSRVLGWTIGCVVVSGLVAELFARLVLGYTPLRYSRPYDPIFVSGDFVGERSRRDLSGATNAPAANGYEGGGLGFYFWGGRDLPRSSTALSDFLFAHYLSRYSSREADSIMCRQPDALRIFVLGGSVAMGSSASSKASTWHALLEKMLRTELQRSDIYVFNAAMGSFNSIQERLAYHLAVFPRAPEFVLIVNGANDLSLAANSVHRPGDPAQLGLRYGQFYNDPLLFWLVERSALFNHIFQARLVASILERREKLAARELFQRYAEATIDLYLENMTAVLRDCEANGTTCLVGVHPVRSLSATYIGSRRHGDYVLPPENVHQMYDLLFRKLAGHRFSGQFVDLTHLIGSEEELGYYTDTVHLDDRGQQALATKLLPVVEAAVRRAKRRSADPVISCERVLPKEIATVDLARMSRLNDAQLHHAEKGVRLLTDPRRWSYSAALTIGDEVDLSAPGTSLRLELGDLDGEIGMALATDIADKQFLSERSVAAEAGDSIVELEVPAGAKRVVLIFRKHAPGEQRSAVSIRRISIQAY